MGGFQANFFSSSEFRLPVEKEKGSFAVLKFSFKLQITTLTKWLIESSWVPNGLTVKQNPQTHGCTCGRFNTSIFDSLLWNRTFHNKQSASSAYCKEELQYMHPQIACHCTFPVFPLCTLFLPESSAGTASPNLKFLKRSSGSLSSQHQYLPLYMAKGLLFTRWWNVWNQEIFLGDSFD